MQAPAASDVPVWTLAGKTSETIATPNGVRAKTRRAYLIDRNSGCAEATAGSIVIVDTDIQPESGDCHRSRKRAHQRLSLSRRPI